MKSSKYISTLAAFSAAVLAAPAPGFAASTLTQTTMTQNNTTGVGFGFWENSFHDDTLRRFGRRPIGRLGISGWLSMEDSATPAGDTCGIFAKYDYTNPDQFAAVFNQNYGGTLLDLQSAHEHGESITLALNMGFMASILGTSKPTTIPTDGCKYSNDITDPNTQQAAVNFVKSFVQYLMGQIGSFNLAIDYETDSNFRLDNDDGTPNGNMNCNTPAGTPTTGWDNYRSCRAQNWGAWYHLLAAAAHKAAAQYNSQHGLTDPAKQVIVNLTPILNGDIANKYVDISPDNISPSGTGGMSQNQWIVNAINDSDALAVDDYHCDTLDAASSVQDPTWLLNALVDWEKYLQAANPRKPLLVTENGIAGYVTDSKTNSNGNCSNTGVTDGKYKGTTTDMVAYYKNLFAQINNKGYFKANVPDLRSFSFWELVDNPTATDMPDRYFGVIDATPSQNPPHYAVGADKTSYGGADLTQNMEGYIKTAETLNPPSTGPAAVAISPSASKPVPVSYTDGFDYSFVTYTPTQAFINGPCTIKYKGSYTVDSDQPFTAYVIIHSYNGSAGNSDQWDSQPAGFNNGAGQLSTKICYGATAMDLYFTGTQFPVNLSLTSLGVSQ
jgi:hypothetical protein